MDYTLPTIMGQNGLLFVAVLVVVIVAANFLASRRRRIRKVETQSFASLQGFRNEGDVNPFLGVQVTMRGAPVMPQMLIDLAAGRGIVRNVLRGSTAAGEVILFDYRPPVTAGDIFSAIAAFRVPGIVEFQLSPRAPFTFAIKHIEFTSHPRFSKRFMVTGNDEAAVRRVFAPAVLDACEAFHEKREWYLQAGSDWLLASFGQTRAEELPELVEQSARVVAAMCTTVTS